LASTRLRLASLSFAPEKSARTSVARNSVAPERSTFLRLARSSLARLKLRFLRSRADRSHSMQFLVAPERNEAGSSACEEAPASIVAATTDESTIRQRIVSIPQADGPRHDRGLIAERT